MRRLSNAIRVRRLEAAGFGKTTAIEATIAEMTEVSVSTVKSDLRFVREVGESWLTYKLDQEGRLGEVIGRVARGR